MEVREAAIVTVDNILNYSGNVTGEIVKILPNNIRG